MSLAGDAPAPGVAVKLSLVWFFALGSLGCIFPFYSLFLATEGGLSGAQVGVVMAVPALVSIFCQGPWGQLADRTGARSRVVALLAIGTAVTCLALALPTHFAGFVIATAAMAIFSAAFIPNTMALTLAQIHDATGRLFGRIRVWGTIGFAITVTSFPFLVAKWQEWTGVAAAGPTDPEPGFRLMFVIGAVTAALTIPFALALPRTAISHARAEKGEWRTLLRNRNFVRLLVVTFLAYGCIQGPMALFPILIRAQGGGLEVVSEMWLLMIALELPLIFFFGKAVAWAGPRGVIAIGLLASAVRWIVSGFVDDLTVVAAAQLLHGAAVFGLILGAPLYVDLSVPASLRSTAQGLLAMVGIAFGGMLSNLAAGTLIEVYGATAPARFGGIGIGVLALSLPLLLPRIDPAATVANQKNAAPSSGR